MPPPFPDSFEARKVPAFRRRVYALVATLALGFAVVTAKLLSLQAQYGAKAGGECPGLAGGMEAAPRGSILSREGEILAEEVPSYDIAVLPRDLPLEVVSLDDFRRFNAAVGEEKKRLEKDLLAKLMEEEPLVARICEAAGITRESICLPMFRALRDAARNYAGDGGWFTIASGLPYERWASLKARNEDPFREDRIPGVRGKVSFSRRYPFGSLAAHVLGTVGQISERQYEEIAEGRLPERSAPSERWWAEARHALSEETSEALAGLLGCRPENIGSASELRMLAARVGCEDELPSRLGISRELLFDGWDDRFRPSPGEFLWLAGIGPDGSKRRARALPDPTIGESGIERRYNQRLRGKSGFRSAASAHSGDGGSTANEYAPSRGEDVRLTLDLGMQRAAEQAFAISGHAGAAVVMKVETGEILVMASAPAFDPNVFAERKGEAVRELLSDDRRPLLNRAIAATYPPGSILKPLVALAALEEGKVRPDERFECSGKLQVGRWTFHCDQKRAHGDVGLIEAIGRSCNVTFYQLGQRCGVDMLAAWAREVGLGEPTGIDLPGEAAGLFPTRQWKARMFADRPGEAGWTLGNDMHLAIGQGYIRVTPLQMCVMMAWVANGGRRVVPRLAEGETAAVRPPGRALSPQALDVVRRGLWHTVNCGTPGNRGTAYSAFHEGGAELSVTVAGKTGTADHGISGREPHAWFCGYAPFERPEVAFAVLVEYGGHGGAMAAPIAKQILKARYDGKGDAVRKRPLAAVGDSRQEAP